MQLLKAQRPARQQTEGASLIVRILLSATAPAALLLRDQPARQTASARAVEVAFLAAMNSAYGLHSTARHSTAQHDMA
jgi:hypothetical protein